MVFVFFYGKLNNADLIKNLDNDSQFYNGYVTVNKYDRENDILEISNKINHNSELLYGKVVKINMDIYELIKKLNENEEYRFNKNNFATIWASSLSGNNVHIVYIIY